MVEKIDTYQRYISLCLERLVYAAAYYEFDTSMVRDEYYDRMARMIKEYEDEHPDDICSFTLTDKVGFSSELLRYDRD